jgi:CDP-3, 6-dideoxy-D-glycero-L-glycero-4-hexulose-4-reductase
MDSKPRILITGGTGYIGSNVMKYLKDNGFEVENVLRYKSIEPYFSIFKPEIVLHFATYFTNSSSYMDARHMEDSNILFGMRIASYCSAYKVKTFVNFTTFQIHYNDEEYNPVNLYAATKKAFMDILEYYHQSGRFRVVNVELNSVYGPWDKRKKLIPILLEAMVNDNKLKLNNRHKKVNLVHISFVCKAIFAIISGSYTNDYIIINGQELELFDIVRSLDEMVTDSKLSENIEWDSHKFERETFNVPKMTLSEDDYDLIVQDMTYFKTYLREIIDNGAYYANLS